MHIVTNFERFPLQWRAANGVAGRSSPATVPEAFLRYTGQDCIWLVNCDPKLTFQLAWRKPGRQAPRLIAADLVLRRAQGWKSIIRRPLHRFLLSRVDHFIHYFRDRGPYEREFSIPSGRSSFVAFKVNLADRFSLSEQPDGDYALCLGRSMRDFDTFFAALERVPHCVGAITAPQPHLMRLHGSRFTRPLDRLPANLRVLPDDGSDESMFELLRGAKLIVLPVLRGSLVASGISTALNAMGLGKCVIGSEGPGMLDVFTQGEVLACPPEDVQALADCLSRAWDDEQLRRRIGQAAYSYAQWAGGEANLYQRIIERIAELPFSQA